MRVSMKVRHAPHIPFAHTVRPSIRKSGRVTVTGACLSVIVYTIGCPVFSP